MLSKVDVNGMVRGAFEKTPVLHVGKLVGQGAYGDECEKIVRGLAGRHWTTLTVSDVIPNDPIILLTPEAKRHYLPAYLTLALVEPTEDYFFIEHLLWVLTPSRNADEFDEIVGAMTTEQKRAVRAVLEFMEGCEDYNSYWDRTDESSVPAALDEYWRNVG